MPPPRLIMCVTCFAVVEFSAPGALEVFCRPKFQRSVFSVEQVLRSRRAFRSVSGARRHSKFGPWSAYCGLHRQNFGLQNTPITRQSADSIRPEKTPHRYVFRCGCVNPVLRNLTRWAQRSRSSTLSSQLHSARVACCLKRCLT